jgi:hypothetical protein
MSALFAFGQDEYGKSSWKCATMLASEKHRLDDQLLAISYQATAISHQPTTISD